MRTHLEQPVDDARSTSALPRATSGSPARDRSPRAACPGANSAAFEPSNSVIACTTSARALRTTRPISGCEVQLGTGGCLVVGRAHSMSVGRRRAAGDRRPREGLARHRTRRQLDLVGRSSRRAIPVVRRLLSPSTTRIGIADQRSAKAGGGQPASSWPDCSLLSRAAKGWMVGVAAGSRADGARTDRPQPRANASQPVTSFVPRPKRGVSCAASHQEGD
jgi:hypothetical protein